MGTCGICWVSGEQASLYSVPDDVITSGDGGSPFEGPENELSMDAGPHRPVLIPSARLQEASGRVAGSMVTSGLASSQPRKLQQCVHSRPHVFVVTVWSQDHLNKDPHTQRTSQACSVATLVCQRAGIPVSHFGPCLGIWTV